MPIPLAYGSAVQVVVIAACLATMVAVFTVSHDEAVTRAARDSITTQLKAAGWGVRAPYDDVVVLTKGTSSVLGLEPIRCKPSFSTAQMEPHIWQMLPSMAARDNRIRYMYSVYLMDRIREGVNATLGSPEPRDYDWGECGCTPPNDPVTNPEGHCYYSQPEPRHGLVVTSAYKDFIRPADIVDETDLIIHETSYGNEAFTLNASDSGGVWGPPDLWASDWETGVLFTQVYYLPLAFSATGRATYVTMTDLSLGWMKDLLVGLNFPATHTTIIQAKLDTLLTTTHDVPLYYAPPGWDVIAGSELEELRAWKTDDVPNAVLAETIRDAKGRLPAAGDWMSLGGPTVFTHNAAQLVGMDYVVVDGGLRLVVFMNIERGYYYNEGEAVRRGTMGIGAAGLVLCVASAVALWVWVTAPLRQMGRDMRDASRLDCDVNRLKAAARSGIAEIAALQGSFLRMNTHLVEARPYLPDALYESMRGEDSEDGHGSAKEVFVVPVLPPCAGETEPAVAIAFTDIVGSTALWEECPDMGRALKLHNQIIRAALAHHGGYEVKTIGDAFMAVFPALASACRFGVEAHDQLLQAQWPTALLEHPRCVRDGKGLWGGIVIRIGVEYGAVNAERNDLTGRYDYFGTPVNTAARLEASAPHGMVCVTAESLRALREDTGTGALKASEYSVHDMGRVVLKGLKDERAVCALSAPKLANRRLGSPALQAAQDVRGSRVGAGVRRAASSVHDDSTGAMEPLRRQLVMPVASLSVACVSVGHDQAVMAAAPQTVTRVVNASLGRVQQALERTSGSLATVVGTTLVATWNAAQVCVAHRAESLRFVSLAKGLRRAYGVEAISVGLSMGRGVHGPVGHAGQRFMMVAGPCVALAQLVCESARDAGEYCRCAGLDGVPYPAVEGAQGCLEERDVWGVASLCAAGESVRQRSSVVSVDVTVVEELEEDDVGMGVDVRRGNPLLRQGTPGLSMTPTIELPPLVVVYHVDIDKYCTDDDIDLMGNGRREDKVSATHSLSVSRTVVLRY